MGKAKNIPKEELEKYILERKTIFDIAESTNISKNTIKKYLNLYGIKTGKGFYSHGKPLGFPKGKKQTTVHISNRLRSLYKNGVPFKGCKHSNESRAKMSKNHADFTGNKNPFKLSLRDPSKLQALKDRRRDWWNSLNDEKIKQIKSNFSKAQILANHQHKSKFYKSGHINTLKSGKIFIRSSWEEWVASRLDLINTVESFEFEKLRIVYFYESVKKYTTCDFVIKLKNKTKILLEVKPKAIQKMKNNPAKIKAYAEYCNKNGWKFVLCDEDLIFNNIKFEELINEFGKFN